jgi:hypothetical protein
VGGTGEGGGRGEGEAADGAGDAVACGEDGVGAVQGGDEVVLPHLEFAPQFAQDLALWHGLVGFPNSASVT